MDPTGLNSRVDVVWWIHPALGLGEERWKDTGTQGGVGWRSWQGWQPLVLKGRESNPNRLFLLLLSEGQHGSISILPLEQSSCP